MVLNEEQQLLQDTLADFLTEHAPIEAFRALRDNPEAPAWDSSLWQQLCELGVPAAALPETEGGLGFGWLGLGAVLAEMGRRLTVTPLISSVVFAAAVIRYCGNSQQRSAWLAAVAQGERIASVAFQEHRYFHLDPSMVERPDGTLSGTKRMVFGARQAHDLLVTAIRDDGQFGVARIATDAPGITIDEEMLFDGHRYATVTFDAVAVASDAWLGDGQNDGESAFGRAVNEAALALSAEMMGGARELLERTVTYLNEREQFGVKIGTFQALQHRCAQAYCQLELAESATIGALAAADQGGTALDEAVSRAKAMAGDALEHISNEAVQLHGGMGVTDEMDIGLFLKRSRVCNQLFGDAHWHRDRFARLRGF